MKCAGGRPLERQQQPMKQKLRWELSTSLLYPGQRQKQELKRFFGAHSIFHFISDGKRCTATSFNYDFVSRAKTQKTGFLLAILFLLLSVEY